MRIIPFTVAAAFLLSSCAQQAGPRGKRPVPFAKNPSIILALDIAQSREALEKNNAYAALLETAADNAITFVPQPVEAKAWLKAQSPLTNTSWQPHSVTMSCDGKTGVTTGAIKWGNVDGYYTTVWQYFQKSNGGGEWRWLLSHGDMLKEPRQAPDFLKTKTASCKGKATAQVTAPAEGVKMKQGFSRDQSLSWTWQYRPDGARILSVNYWDGDGWKRAFIDKVRAQKTQ